MTTTVPTTAIRQVPTDALRTTALLAGGLYLITFLASIPPVLFLYSDVLNDPAYIVSAGGDTRVVLGGFLDLITALAGIGTAVVLFPVVKRQNEAAALGFVTARVFEAAMIAIGVVSLLSLVTLHQDVGATAGADGAALIAVGQSLVAVYDWTFLLGPCLVAVINALLLGSLLYRSGLVPRVIPTLGLIGAPLLLASVTAAMFGLHDHPGSVWSGLATAPIFVWELSLGVWLVVKGFTPSPITAGTVSAEDRSVHGDAAVSSAAVSR